MKRDNWKRNQIISAAAQRIMKEADPSILTAGRKAQYHAVMELRRKLQAETNASFDTTSRHISIHALRRTLQ